MQTIDILMEDEAMQDFVFAILRTKEEKKYRKATRDLVSELIDNLE